MPHPDWNGHTEAEVIIQHLLAAGIPEEAIKSESSSSNTLENVLFAKEILLPSRATDGDDGRCPASAVRSPPSATGENEDGSGRALQRPEHS